MPRRDEDALSWDGDDDPTLDTGKPAAADDPADANPVDPAPLPDGWTAVGRGSESAGHPASAPATATAEGSEDVGLGTAALVSIGVLGGVYLLFAIGWLVGGLRLQGRYQVLVTDSMYQGALWLATAAPLIWFATTLFATRGSRAWVRWLWLAFGVLLLIPWPFLMIGAVGR
jgi:hypothetical protein